MIAAAALFSFEHLVLAFGGGACIGFVLAVLLGEG